MRVKVYGVTTVFLFFKRKKEQLQKTSSGEGLLGADPCAALNGLLHQLLLRGGLNGLLRRQLLRVVLEEPDETLFMGEQTEPVEPENMKIWLRLLQL